ncbi:MAG: hypothetical protein EPN97_06050 [Alphaproteobacteria bacterium]|nr:MAG: hypothetical protein EPN97_06050 [Alphaproteobacteria bacterium]
MIDGYFSDTWKGAPHKEFTAAALAALEKAVPDAEERVALLTSANIRGQTAIHKALAFGGYHGTFEPVFDALYKWAGDEKAGAILKDILTQPLGQIDKDISFALQDVRRMCPNKSPEFHKVDALTTDSYHPVTAAGLRAAVDEIRPIIREWLAQEKPDSDYSKQQKAKMQAFADDPDPVTERGTLLTGCFPGKAFAALLDILQKSDPLPPQGQADRIFGLLSKQGPDGNTPMHIEWQASDLLGTPKAAGHFTDRLSPLLATFDRMLGTEVAVGLANRLLLQENAKGELPMDIFQYPKLPVRDFALDKFLQTLRKEMGSKEKFTTYMTEVVAAVLPADYKVNMASFEPVELNPATGQPKPKRGAKLDF